MKAPPWRRNNKWENCEQEHQIRRRLIMPAKGDVSSVCRDGGDNPPR